MNEDLRGISTPQWLLDIINNVGSARKDFTDVTARHVAQLPSETADPQWFIGPKGLHRGTVNPDPSSYWGLAGRGASPPPGPTIHLPVDAEQMPHLDKVPLNILLPLIDTARMLQHEPNADPTPLMGDLRHYEGRLKQHFGLGGMNIGLPPS